MRCLEPVEVLERGRADQEVAGRLHELIMNDEHSLLRPRDQNVFSHIMW